MFRAREEQLKDFKKLIRITKKLITIIQERNNLERQFLIGLEEYFKIEKDIIRFEANPAQSEYGKEAMREYVKFLRKQLKEFEEKITITSEQRRVKRKVDILSNQIDEYVRYILSKSHDFNSFNLTPEEYKLCECDDLPLFIILLIFKEEIIQINDRNISERNLLNEDSHYYFRRRVFLQENAIRTILTQKFSEGLERKINWEEQEDLMYFPIFKEFDFESFVKFL